MELGRVLPATIRPDQLSSIGLDQVRACPGDQVMQLSLGAQPLCAEIEGCVLTRWELGIDSAAKAATCLEKRDGGPRLHQPLGRGEARESTTDDDDVHAVVREPSVRDEVGVLWMVAEPLRHVPATGNDPEAFGPSRFDRGLDQPGRDAAAAIGRWDEGAVELDQTRPGWGIGEHRSAPGAGDGEAAGDEIVLDRH